MDRLNPVVRASLAAQPDKLTLDDLAKIADKIMDSIGALQPQTQVSAVATSAESAILEQLTKLQLQLNEMQCSHRREIAAVRSELEEGRRGRSNSRLDLRDRSPSYDRGRSSIRGRSSSRPPVQYDGMCWYHFTFGDSARKCKAPCRLSGKFNTSSENQTGGH